MRFGTYLGSALAVLALVAPAVRAQAVHELFQQALLSERVDGHPEGSIELYLRVARESTDRELAARALLRAGGLYEILGSPEALALYRRLVQDYQDQAEAAAEAGERLAALTPEVADLPQSSDGLVARRIWGERINGWLMAGSVSPNGREIAATDWAGTGPGNFGDLIVVDAETGARRVAGETDAGSRDGSSFDTYVNGFAWSKDGTRLAYSEWVFFPDARGFQALKVVNADGSGGRVVSNSPQNADLRPRAWSSDGGWVIALATGWDDVASIAKISLDDGSTTILKTLRSGFGETQRRYMTLSLSPDDRYVAYAYAPSPGDRPDVRVLAVDGSSENVIAPNGATDINPLWTPDGSRLVFLSDRSGSGDLWVVEMSDGEAVGEPYVVQAGVGPIRPLGFTADGSLTYEKSVPMGALSIVDLPDGEAFLDRDKPLTDRFIGSNSDPVWSPDGTRIAFVRTRWGVGFRPEHYLVVRSLADGSESDIELTGIVFHASGRTRPQWSEDGTSVFFAGGFHAERGETGAALEEADYRVDVETGEIRREPHLWSSQSFWYYATGRQEERLRSLGIRIDGFRRTVEAIQNGHDVLRPGERLLWFRGIPGWVEEFDCDEARSYSNRLCSDGSLREPLFGESKALGDLNGWRLSPDGERIAYRLRDDQGVRDLWVRSVTMDDEPTLLQADAGRGPVVWTPDGRYVLFSSAAGDDVAPVYRVDATGGDPELLPWPPLTGPQLEAMSFDPEGRRAVLPVGERVSLGEIWSLSGFPWESGGNN